MTGAWSLGAVPLRALRSTHAARTRAGYRRTGQDQVDPHPEVLVEHARPVVPVGEHTAGRPAVADHVVQAERLQFGQRGPLRGRDVGLADVGTPGRTRPRRWARCSCLRRPAPPPGPPRRVAERCQPFQLVAVVVRVGLAAVRYVDRVHPHAAAGGGHRARLRVREAGRPRESSLDVVQAGPRQDRDAVPRRAPRTSPTRSPVRTAPRPAVRRTPRRRSWSPAGRRRPAAARPARAAAAAAAG